VLFCLSPLFVKRRRFGFALLASLMSLFLFVPGCGGGGSTSIGGGGGGGGGGNVVATPSTITLSTSSAKVPSGASFILSVMVTGTGTVPTGSVNVFQGPVGMGSGVAPPIALVDGKASVTVPAYLQPGIYPYWAQYLGDAHNQPSQSGTAIQQAITGPVQLNYTAQTGTLAHGGSIQIVLQ
jgi:hypothetical protein